MFIEMQIEGRRNTCPSAMYVIRGDTWNTQTIRIVLNSKTILVSDA